MLYSQCILCRWVLDYLIGVVWRAEVHHGFIDGIGGLVWEDAGGQAGYQLLDPELM